MNRDRVHELYHGDLSDPATQRCRDRIHWICAQAEGERVLDVGCSQGIACLILGREGFECTGVDLEHAALEFARAARDAEDDIVRRRIDFRSANALDLPFPDGSFDTVLLGEILEHLTHPDRVLGEAGRVLKEGGKLVVTVPYGLKPHPDHKRVFYPGSLLDLVEPYFRTSVIDAFEHYLVYCGVKDSSPSPPAPDGRAAGRLRMLPRVEARCLAKELALHETNSRLHREVRALKGRVAELEAERRERDEAPEAREAEIRAAAAEEETTRQRLEEAQRRSDARVLELEVAHRAELEALRASAQEARADLQAALAAKDREVRLRLALQEEEWRKRFDAREDSDVARRTSEDTGFTAALQALSDRLRELQKQAERRARAEERERKSRREEERVLAAERIRAVVASSVPAGATVLVVSRGDEELRRLDGRRGLHFPQGPDGVYAGHHPANDADAVAQLDALRAAGADYLVLPSSAYWWLEHYSGFRRHLETRYEAVAFEERACLIVSLRHEGSRGAGSALPRPASAAPPAWHRADAPGAPETLAASNGNGSRSGAGAVALLPPPTRGGNGTAVPLAGIALALAPAPAHAEPCPEASSTGRVAIAGVLDEFTTDCLRPECRLITFRPDNWRDVLERETPRAVFVESAWRGNGGSWQYRVAKYPNTVGVELDQMLLWAREREIPTLFWNKEDPVHFDRFIERAGRFQHVFTTDAGCVAAYRERLGHDRVDPLPFAAQPAIHNPVLDAPRDGMVCFAGTYYGDRHAERRSDMDHILRPALEFGLDIYDRQHGLAGRQAELYRFPDVYQPCIRGRLEYDEMVRAYKRYRVFLNVNSVKDSSTMFSRRVFELLASGTPVVSTYSRGIAEMLGEDLVHFAETEDETRRHLERLLNDAEAWDRSSLRGIRKVMTEHTYGERVRYALARVGIDFPAVPLPRLAVIASAATPRDVERLAIALGAQAYRPVDIVLFAEDPLTSEALEPLGRAVPGARVTRVSPLGGDPLGACLAATAADYLAWLDARDHYGRHYLGDVALAAMYSGAPMLGKHAHARVADGGRIEGVGDGCQYRRTASVPAGTLAVRRDALSDRLLGECRAERTVRRPTDEVLSIDRFNYLQDAWSAGEGWRGERLADRVEV